MTLGKRYVTQWSNEPGKMSFIHYAVAGSIVAFILTLTLINTMLWWTVILPGHIALLILHLVVGLYIDIRLEVAA